MKAGSLIGIAFVAGSSFFCASTCIAQEVELKDKFGLWSVYCLEDAKPRSDMCSTTAGVHANDNPDFWTKVAITIGSSSGDLAMTVRTPFLKNLRSGISLGFDGRQAVKGIIDNCSNSFCESTIALDESLMNQIATRKKMSIEYQVSDQKSALLILDLDQILPALHSMRAGMRSAMASANDSKTGAEQSAPVRLVLERRKFERAVTASSKSAEAWKAPFQKCSEAPVTKVVVVNSDLTVQNEHEFREWTDKSSKCNADAVTWIKGDTNGNQTSAALGANRMASWTLYNYVSKLMPTGVVPEEGSRVAVVPEQTIEMVFPYTAGKGSKTTGQASFPERMGR